MRVSLAAAALALTWASPAIADVTVTDGDTLRLDGTTYRLWGIDAAEYRQTCADGWPAGVMAFDALRDLVRGHAVTCEPKTTDRYGRTVAICRADGVDLGAAMVRAGQALAFVRYSSEYAQKESEARAARAGVHAHDCAPPWIWRRGR